MFRPRKYHNETHWYREQARKILANQNVTIWDSHLNIDFEYFKLCTQYSGEKFNCNDAWHPHTLVFNTMGRMLLQEHCSQN